MNICFIFDKLGFDDLRMCSFNGGEDCFIVDFFKLFIFDLVSEFLCDIVKGSIDLYGE